jgi:hypothetical protein
MFSFLFCRNFQKVKEAEKKFYGRHIWIVYKITNPRNLHMIDYLGQKLLKENRVPSHMRNFTSCEIHASIIFSLTSFREIVYGKDLFSLCRPHATSDGSWSAKRAEGRAKLQCDDCTSRRYHTTCSANSLAALALFFFFVKILLFRCFCRRSVPSILQIFI